MALSPEAGFPPATFNLTAFVFRPDIPYVPRGQLQQQIEALNQHGRFRTALRLLLTILREAPHDQEALSLAMVVLGRARTEQVQADEALGYRYLLDPCLDPLYAVCSHCKRTSWAPANCLFAHAMPHAVINNPLGLQCSACGYVMCRKCHQGITNCLNCGMASLRSTVYPTGRLSAQLGRRASPVVCAIILREGPISPDGEWIQTLLDPLSPDVLEDNAHILGYGLHPWRPDVKDLAVALAAEVQGTGRYGRLDLDHAISAEVRSADGLRVFVVKLYA